MVLVLWSTAADGCSDARGRRLSLFVCCRSCFSESPFARRPNNGDCALMYAACGWLEWWLLVFIVVHPGAVATNVGTKGRQQHLSQPALSPRVFSVSL